MRRQDIILNSIVFKEKLDRGIYQADLIPIVADLDVKGLEIRREFFQFPKSDIRKIVETAKYYNLPLFYSVSEDFFCGGEVNASLNRFRDEASILGSPFIKLNTGSSVGIDVNQLTCLSDTISQGPQILLENNQTPGHASLSNCQSSMSLICQANLPIGFVFDTANWVFVNEDPYEASQLLKEVTTYLHCKNYQIIGGNPTVSDSFYKGQLNIIDLIKSFDKVDYLALEYPSSFNQLKADLDRLEIDLSQ